MDTFGVYGHEVNGDMQREPESLTAFTTESSHPDQKKRHENHGFPSFFLYSTPHFTPRLLFRRCEIHAQDCIFVNKGQEFESTKLSQQKS
jgi:hypothetical protein